MTLKTVAALLAMMVVGALAHQPWARGTEIKIATLSPEGSYWMEKMRSGAEEVG